MQDYFDQSLDEIKLLRYVNNSDPEDEHHIVRLYDFFYYKVNPRVLVSRGSGPRVCKFWGSWLYAKHVRSTSSKPLYYFYY